MSTEGLCDPLGTRWAAAAANDKPAARDPVGMMGILSVSVTKSGRENKPHQIFPWAGWQ